MIRALLSVGLLLTSAAGAALYRVAGVVVDATTNRPMAHARVILGSTETSQVIASLITGDDGRFSFDAPPGKFRLTAGSRTAGNGFGTRAPDAAMGAAVVTGPGQDTTNLVFRWYPPAGISGKVVDQYGDPVESAIVQLLTSRVTGGRRTVNTWSYFRTDDQGNYRFGPVPGGTYYLTVSGEPWHERDRDDPNDHAPSLAYAPIHSGNTRDASRAAPITVRPGEEARADFIVSAVPGAIVTVKHDGPAGLRGSVNLLMDGVGGSEGYQLSESLNGYQQETRFRGVPPGRYVLRLTGTTGGKSMGATEEVVVTGVEATIEVKVRPLATVSGRVEVQDPKAPRKGALYARLSAYGRTQQTVVRPDGSFSFPRVQTGKYRPMVSSADGYFAARIEVGGAEFRDGEIDVREGQEITVQMVASGETGKVEGFVMDGERPIEGMLVVLAAAVERKELSGYRAFQTDTDGSFEWRVPAGDYILFAVENTNFEYANPDAVRPYRSLGKPVRVEARETSSHRIGVTAAPAERH